MIPVNQPVCGPNEIQYATDCLVNSNIAVGDYVAKFEQAWSEYCDRKHGIAVCNGTAALHLAVNCLDLPPGSEVIVPSFTIISCITAIIQNGLVPILVDADKYHWCINIVDIERKITSKTKAIMPVHIYGCPVEMNEINHIAKKYNLYVIEDAAEAHGAKFNGKRCGSFGDISCFSFYGNKLIMTGEGGMVLTDNDNIAAKLRSKRNLCFGTIDRFIHNDIGFNYRMPNILAAIGLGQFERFDDILKKKQWIWNTYTDLLDNLPVRRQIIPLNCDPICWMYGIVTEKPAKLVMSELLSAGIETRPFFGGMHRQPGIYSNDEFPVTDWLSEFGFYLPSGIGLEIDQIVYVVQQLRRILNV